LFTHLKREKRFSEERAKFYAAQIVLALECLHEHNTIYRDLKPENILLDKNGYLKITDFGLSKRGDRKTYTFCGTPEYLAPEIITGVGHDKAVDWWSLGTLLYEMLSGRCPFYSKNRKEMFAMITDKPVTPRKEFSEEATDLIQKLLDRNPKKRIGSEGAYQIKEHPFFEDIDFDALYRQEIEAPFIPRLTSADDLQHIDRMFVDEPPVETPVDSNITMRYQGFTYKDKNPLHEKPE